jgi:hydroxyacylglutathione hydrolase
MFRMNQVFAIPAFRDNYIWAIRDAASTVVVDPGDAAPVLAALEAHSLRLAGILVTHHHWDHTNGIKELTEAYDVPVWGPAQDPVPTATVALREGDGADIGVAGVVLKTLEIPGHTLGHIALTGAGMLFCGDTLFAGGCGRIFEGTPAQMYASLQRLAKLPPETRVFCGHEYTEANLRFALRVEPDNEALQARLERVARQRAAGEITLPSTLGEELATNPFLRVDRQSVIDGAERQLGKRLSSPIEVFAAVRAWKDAG